MQSQTLLVVGSGPGIALSTTALFASSAPFSKIALLSRDPTRLSQDREAIIKALISSTPPRRGVEVRTYSVDISKTIALKEVLKKVEEFAGGTLGCVLFNAARVGLSSLSEFSEEELMLDFMTTNVALLHTFRWALPLFASPTPAFLVTSSLLWQSPIPALFALSMVKASQRNLVQSLAAEYPDIHTALLNVGGPVSDEDPTLNPTAIAKKFWELYSQHKAEWTIDLTILP